MQCAKRAAKLRDNEWRNVCKTYPRERVGESPCQRDGGIGEGRRSCKPIGGDDVEPDRHGQGSGLGSESYEDRQDQSKRRYVLGKPLRGTTADLRRELKQWQIKHQMRGQNARDAACQLSEDVTQCKSLTRV